MAKKISKEENMAQNMENIAKRSVKDFAEMLMLSIPMSRPELAGRISVQEVKRNNGEVLCGLRITNPLSNVAPVIYVERAYDNYLAGKMPYSDIVDAMIEVYDKSAVRTPFSVDAITNFELAKNFISARLINAEANAEMLEDIPHLEFGDLAVTFQVNVSGKLPLGDGDLAKARVDYNVLDAWGVEIEEVYDCALANMKRNGTAQIVSMAEMMAEMMGIAVENLPVVAPTYVLTNKERVYGAAEMLLPDVLKSFSESVGNFYVLPSSVHELILAPEGILALEDLEAMVPEVNSTTLEPDEFLSDNVYFYDAEKEQLQFASTGKPIGIGSGGDDRTEELERD